MTLLPTDPEHKTLRDHEQDDHALDQPPEYAVRDWGLTVACGEGRCDQCKGTRFAYTPKGRFAEVGPCTCSKCEHK